jgi:hypothetical protein
MYGCRQQLQPKGSMNGFRTFVIVALVAIAVGLFLAKGPTSCRPPDVSDCTWNNTTNRYDCPKESK